MGNPTTNRSVRPTRIFAIICSGCGTIFLLLFVVIPLWFDGVEPLERVELAFSRAIVDWGEKSPERNDIVFVGVDNVSVNLLETGVMSEEEIAASPALDLMSYGYPFPRQVWAILVDRLLASGAKAVVFDIVFSHGQAESEGDRLLKEALDRHRDRVVIASRFSYTEAGKVMGGSSMNEPAATVLDPGGVEDRRQGYANFFKSPDQLVWQAHFRMRLGPHPQAPEYRSLAAAGLSQSGYGHMVPDDPVIGIRFAEMHASPRAYEPVPLYSIFDEKAWSRNYENGGFFHDKIVVVGGWNLIEHRDVVDTPVGTIAGAQVHINAIASLLNEDGFLFAGFTLRCTTVLLGALLAFIVAHSFRHPLLGIGLLLGIGVGYVCCVVAVYNRGLMLNGAAPVGTLISAGILCFAAQYSLERLEKLRLRRALDRYFSKDLSAEILARPEGFLDSLGGKRVEVTVLFSDLRDFTANSEMTDEREIVTQLNEYLKAMVDCVFENGGMIDKFIGDAVMAVWGTVHSDGEDSDALGAVRAALAMRARLSQLNEKWSIEGRRTYRFGIGINQGPAVFGNIGSLEKMELTVIGDAVNLASRLEGLTKQFGVDLLVSGRVAEKLGGNVLLRPVHEVIPRGKTESLMIFSVPAASEPELSPGEIEFLKLYNQAHGAWCEANPEKALDLFRRCAALRPEDRMVEVFLARLAKVQGNPGLMRMPLAIEEK